MGYSPTFLNDLSLTVAVALAVGCPPVEGLGAAEGDHGRIVKVVLPVGGGGLRLGVEVKHHRDEQEGHPAGTTRS